MAKISQKTIDLIKDTADIVDVVSEFVPLSQAGKNMKGLCPFHSEKTPSFFVSKERQMFNCFGCGKKGNAITFIEEYKHLSFVDALKYLADKYHIDLEVDTSSSRGQSHENLYRANQLAEQFFSLNLLNIESGKPALDYLLDRGLTFDVIETFDLGYAPTKGNALYTQLSGEFQPLELINAGLINRRNDGGYYDLFRSRIMFPIADESGRIVAFSGRIFNDSDNPAKYVNTPFTEIFSKSQILYNLHRALPMIRSQNRVILMEGYMDVIKAHMAGLAETVCSMGTQLTIEQAELIKKYTDNVVLCYDGDRAGREATYKALKLLEQVKLNVQIVALPDEQDPDEYISTHDDFKDFFEGHKTDPFEFIYQMIVEDRDLSKPSDLESAKNRLFDFFGKTSGMIREIYLKRFASDTHINYQTLLADYQQAKIDERIMADFKYKIHHQPTPTKVMPKYEKAEKAVLNYYLKSVEYRQTIDARFNLMHFQNTDLRMLMYSARSALKQNPAQPLVVLKAGLTDAYKKALDECIATHHEYSAEDLEYCIRTLESARIMEDISKLKDEASLIDIKTDLQAYLEIQENIRHLQSKNMELKGRNHGQKTNY